MNSAHFFFCKCRVTRPHPPAVQWLRSPTSLSPLHPPAALRLAQLAHQCQAHHCSSLLIVRLRRTTARSPLLLFSPLLGLFSPLLPSSPLLDPNPILPHQPRQCALYLVEERRKERAGGPPQTLRSPPLRLIPNPHPPFPAIPSIPSIPETTAAAISRPL